MIEEPRDEHRMSVVINLETEPSVRNRYMHGELKLRIYLKEMSTAAAIKSSTAAQSRTVH